MAPRVPARSPQRPVFRDPCSAPREVALNLLTAITKWATGPARDDRVLVACGSSAQRAALAAAVLARHLGKAYRLRFAAATIRPLGEADDRAAKALVDAHGLGRLRLQHTSVSPELIAGNNLVLATDRATLRSLQRRCTSAHAHKLHLVSDFIDGLAGTDAPYARGGSTASHLELVAFCEMAAKGISRHLGALTEPDRTPASHERPLQSWGGTRTPASPISPMM